MISALLVYLKHLSFQLFLQIQHFSHNLQLDMSIRHQFTVSVSELSEPAWKPEEVLRHLQIYYYLMISMVTNLFSRRSPAE